jgi:hypothetical protein
MQEPLFDRGNVRAHCPLCGVPTTFEFEDRTPGQDVSSLGIYHVGPIQLSPDLAYRHSAHVFMRCCVCSRPAVAYVAFESHLSDGMLLDFWPKAKPSALLPTGVPQGIVKEFREAETCIEAEAWRGAAGLLRSALEKTLRANGYNEQNLYRKIEAAGTDGVITSARRQRAQDLVRTLGNDVLHDDWRPVTREEVRDAHHYVGRVIEDLYDDRATVEAVLRAKGRIPP